MTPVDLKEAELVARAVIAIFRLWKPDDDAACRMLGIDRQSYVNWAAGTFKPIANETLLRLVILIRIYVSLRMIFPDPNRGHGWMRRPNAIFQGQRPLDVLARGDLDSLRRVRAYVEAEAQG